LIQEITDLKVKLFEIRRILAEHRTFAAKFITDDLKAEYLAKGVDLALKELAQQS